MSKWFYNKFDVPEYPFWTKVFDGRSQTSWTWTIFLTSISIGSYSLWIRKSIKTTKMDCKWDGNKIWIAQRQKSKKHRWIQSEDNLRKNVPYSFCDRWTSRYDDVMTQKRSGNLHHSYRTKSSCRMNTSYSSDSKTICQCYYRSYQSQYAN